MKQAIFLASLLFVLSIVAGVRLAVQSVKDNRETSWRDLICFFAVVVPFSFSCVGCYEEWLKLNKPKDSK